MAETEKLSPNFSTKEFLGISAFVDFIKGRQESVVFLDSDNSIREFGRLRPFEQITPNDIKLLKSLISEHRVCVVSLQPNTSHWIAELIDQLGQPTLPPTLRRLGIPSIGKPPKDFLHPFSLSKTDENILRPAIDYCRQRPGLPVFVVGDRTDDTNFAQKLSENLSCPVTMCKLPDYGDRASQKFRKRVPARPTNP